VPVILRRGKNGRTIRNVLDFGMVPKVSRQKVFIYVQRDGLTVSKGNTATWPGVGFGEEWGLHKISS